MNSQSFMPKKNNKMQKLVKYWVIFTASIFLLASVVYFAVRQTLGLKGDNFFYVFVATGLFALFFAFALFIVNLQVNQKRKTLNKFKI